MKLLLLLSDEAQIAHRRDAELKMVQEEKDDAKEKVAVLLDELLRKPSSSNVLAPLVVSSSPSWSLQACSQILNLKAVYI